MNRRTILKFLSLAPIAIFIRPTTAHSRNIATQILARIPNQSLEEVLMFGPPRRGELLVVAGRPYAGKSTLLLGLLDRLTFQRNEQSLYFSLERNREDLLRHWREVTEYPEAFPNAINAEIYDTHRASLTYIRHIVEAGKIAKPDLRYVFIDYLQLMPRHEAGIERADRGNEILRQLKQMSVELNVAVVLAAQLNRDHEQKIFITNIRGVTDPSPIDSLIRVSRGGH